MITDTIRKIIQEQYVDNDKNEKINFLIENVEITKNIVGKTTFLIDKLFSKKHHEYSIICDEKTYKVLGETLEQQLSDFHCNTLILPLSTKADDVNVRRIIDFSSYSDVLIAVGSGTINDLCKYASYKQNKDYMVFGTAPSMNGYCSANASIIVEGSKKTLQAHLPKAAFFDIDILANAPKRLIASGIGDSLCRSTCEIDWLFSHLIANTYFNKTAFELLRKSENKLLNTLHNNPNYANLTEILIENLILSGIGMCISGGSYPASQGEHMIAHYIDMFVNENNNHKNFHGEDIAVTTLYMAELQNKILSQNKIKLKYCNFTERDFVNKFGEEKGIYFYSEYKEKFPNEEYVNYLNKKLEDNWNNIRAELQKVMLQTKYIKTLLQKINAPITYSELNWSKKIFDEAITNAHLTRNRLTFLDVIH